MPVNSERSDYNAFAGKWKRLRDVCAGREAVIKAGNAYAPDLPGADTAANAAYRSRGNFFNATKRTVQAMVGAILQSPPDVKFPEQDYLDDMTLTNVNFEMFAAEACEELMTVARFGVLVDMPPAPAEGEAASDLRPYCVAYKAEDIINWRTERRGGDDILCMVVLYECLEVPDEKDPFVFKSTPQYRVVELKNNQCTVQLWREKTPGSKEFIVFGPELVAMRRGVALDFIPFVFLGAAHSSPDIEDPPLLDLADVNLSHWRNSVDHEHGLHLVALPTPWVSGMKAEGSGPIKIGPSTVWELSVNGKAGMLEFNGTGLASLVAAMNNKEKQMAILGARVLEGAADVQETAAAVRMRHAGEHANLRTVAASIEQGLTLVLEMMEWWSGTQEKLSDTSANVELNKEYLNVKALALEVQVALTALQAGKISFETWWNFLTTGGWGREGIDSAAEQQQIKKEKPVVVEPVVNPDLSPSDTPPPAGA